LPQAKYPIKINYIWTNCTTVVFIKKYNYKINWSDCN